MSPINIAPEEITLTAVRAWSAEEVIDLYRAGGWWEMGWDKSQIPSLINGSYLVIIARDSENNAVGMGRLISDGSSDCYIQDVVVFPEYREQRIGSRIVTALKRIAELTGHTWIGLISAPGKELFYERAGFSRMENYTPMLKEE
ncbi:GNAT family N-acetyltransferase [Methanocorpusculum sp.]|nr:GNAT family N-acetyltransferase [Methanocorpusculum sp.]